MIQARLLLTAFTGESRETDYLVEASVTSSYLIETAFSMASKPPSHFPRGLASGLQIL